MELKCEWQPKPKDAQWPRLIRLLFVAIATTVEVEKLEERRKPITVESTNKSNCAKN